MLLTSHNNLYFFSFQTGENERAASATYTVLMHDIGNSLMMSNMQFYINDLKVDVTKIKDLEELV